MKKTEDGREEKKREENREGKNRMIGGLCDSEEGTLIHKYMSKQVNRSNIWKESRVANLSSQPHLSYV